LLEAIIAHQLFNDEMKTFLLLFFLFMTTSVFAQNDTVYCESGLKYVQLKPGVGKKAMNGQRVKVSYVGKLMTGEVFEALEDGDVFMFKIGDPGIISAWNEGFKLMSTGEKGIFITPPFLAYGTKGAKDPTGEKEYLVPPNATLIFEVELISIK
jgi:FKBP-type peptidyl-prolyl cis-trans isomerase